MEILVTLVRKFFLTFALTSVAVWKPFKYSKNCINLISIVCSGSLDTKLNVSDAYCSTFAGNCTDYFSSFLRYTSFLLHVTKSTTKFIDFEFETGNSSVSIAWCTHTKPFLLFKFHFALCASSSILQLFILLTTANYPDVMMPVYNCNWLSFLPFGIYLVLGLYLIFSLVLAVVYTHFQVPRERRTIDFLIKYNSLSLIYIQI